MDEFKALRQAAADKRDAAIRRAKDDYACTLKKIAELERDIMGIVPRNGQSIAECINTLIPSDKTFTIADIMAGLKAIDPDRHWRKRSVENRIRELIRKGIIKRVQRSRGGKPAIYAHSDIPIDSEPSQGTTLADAAASCLEDGPMTLAELVVAILESGYEAKTDKKTLLRSVGSALRRNPERFTKTGDEWAVK